MKKVRNKFPRSLSLKSRKDIGDLFSNPEFKLNLYPFLFLAKRIEGDVQGNRYLFSVSKRNFKKAVQRNRIKRMLREKFRLEFISRIQEQHASVHSSWNLAIVYIGREETQSPELSKSVNKCFNEFAKRTF